MNKENRIIESIGLMNDKCFMKSFNLSKAQIQKREFVDGNTL